MTQAQRGEVLDFGIAVAREFPNLKAYEVRDRAQGLMFTARQLAAGNLRRCNDPTDEAFEKRMERLESNARQAAEGLGTQVVTNRDPRGYALYLVLPSGNTGGDWGGRGYPVPEV